MLADRHIVMGVGGTAITSPSAVLLVDAAPDSVAVARSAEAVVASLDVDALADRLTGAHASFAMAVGVDDGVAVVVCGDGTATIDDRQLPQAANDRPVTSMTTTADAAIVLSLAGQHAETGQWLTTGVIAAGAVAVGRLQRRSSPVPAPAAPDRVAADRVASGATVGGTGSGADEIDFGSLLGTASGKVVRSTPSGGRADAPERSGGSPSRVARTEPTAAYTPPSASASDPVADAEADHDVGADRVQVDRDRIRDRGGDRVQVSGDRVRDRGDDRAQVSDDRVAPATAALVFSDGQRAVLDVPVVVGRRPPSEPVDGSSPQRVTVDDRLLSRHHATFRLVDDRLVVVDEDSTNGTFVILADGTRERCPAGRSIEVPAGATVDVGGVVTVTHERGARDLGPSSC